MLSDESAPNTPAQGIIHDVICSPNGRWLIMAVSIMYGRTQAAPRYLRFDIENNKFIDPYIMANRAETNVSVAISADSKWLGMAWCSGFMLMDMETSSNTAPIKKLAYSIAISPDNTWLATGGYKGTSGACELWDLAERYDTPRKILMAPLGRVIQRVVISPCGNWLAAISGNACYLWDSQTYEPIGNPLMHNRTLPSSAAVQDVQISPDGNFLATTVGNFGYLWDFNTRECKILRGHTSIVTCVAISSSDWLVTGSFDKTCRVWNLNTGEPIETPPIMHEEQIQSIAINPDNSEFYVVGGSKCAIWNSNTFEIKVIIDVTDRLGFAQEQDNEILALDQNPESVDKNSECTEDIVVSVVAEKTAKDEIMDSINQVIFPPPQDNSDFIQEPCVLGNPKTC